MCLSSGIRDRDSPLFSDGRSTTLKTADIFLDFLSSGNSPVKALVILKVDCKEANAPTAMLPVTLRIPSYQRVSYGVTVLCVSEPDFFWLSAGRGTRKSVAFGDPISIFFKSDDLVDGAFFCFMSKGLDVLYSSIDRIQNVSQAVDHRLSLRQNQAIYALSSFIVNFNRSIFQKLLKILSFDQFFVSSSCCHEHPKIEL